MRNISVYRRRCDGKIVLVRLFEHINDLFKTVYSDDHLKAFHTNFNHREAKSFAWDQLADREFTMNWWIPWKVRYSYVAFDERGYLVTPDRLVGMYRAYIKEVHKNRYPKYMIDQLRNPGHKSTPYNYYRHIRTTQERRWAHAWDDQEFAPKVRAARNARNLTNAWDDVSRMDWHTRSWKRHRDHQWKEKKVTR